MHLCAHKWANSSPRSRAHIFICAFGNRETRRSHHFLVECEPRHLAFYRCATEAALDGVKEGKRERERVWHSNRCACTRPTFNGPCVRGLTFVCHAVDTSFEWTNCAHHRIECLIYACTLNARMGMWKGFVSQSLSAFCVRHFATILRKIREFRESYLVQRNQSSPKSLNFTRKAN